MMIIAIIPAKGQSNRLPNKNILLLNKKPLLYYSIKKAKESKLIDKIFVSTDSSKIEKIARRFKVSVIKREKDLSGDAPLLEVYLHAIKKIRYKNIKYIVCLQPDHPTRKIDIDSAIKFVMRNNLDDLISVDKYGFKNGSIRILKVNNLLKRRISLKLGTIIDDCVNIHNMDDLRAVEAQLMARERKIKINSHTISDSDRTFVIAEAACNHMCNIELAKKMIQEAKFAGADAIKFQTYKANRLVIKDAKSYWNYPSSKSQFEYYKKLDKFDKKEYNILFRYAKEKNIIAFSTPFDIKSAQMLNDLNVPLFKIASCDILDIRLIKKVASFGKPIILSTGGAILEEIKQAVNTIYEVGNFNLILMVCTFSYPTKNSDAHLLRVRKFKELFPNIIIGLSDHTEPDSNMIIPSLAVSLGAKIIEKHFTLDRSWKGSGHNFSVDPPLLKKMIQNIKITEKVMGIDRVGILKCEIKSRMNARRSIVADRFIRK